MTEESDEFMSSVRDSVYSAMKPYWFEFNTEELRQNVRDDVMFNLRASGYMPVDVQVNEGSDPNNLSFRVSAKDDDDVIRSWSLISERIDIKLEEVL